VKDLAHARAELLNLSRGAADDRDNSVMNEQIQMRLRESLMTEVVAVITPPSSPDESKGSPSNVMDIDTSSDDNGSSPDVVQESNDNSNERHLGKYLTKCANEVKELSTAMKNKKMKLEECKSNVLAIKYEFNAISNRIERDQKTQNKWSDEVDEKRRELDIEKQRNRCVKESIQRARKLNGDHAQRLADDSKTLSSCKAGNAKIESRLEKEKISIDDSLRDLCTQLSSSVEAESELSGHLETLGNQFTERDKIVSNLAEIRKKQEEKQKITESLRAKENKLKKELLRLSELHHEKDVRLSDTKKEKELIEKLKIDNDKTETDDVMPTKHTLSKLLEEEEALARTITQFHDSKASAQEATEMETKNNAKLLHDLNSKSIELDETIKMKSDDIAKMKNMRTEMNISAKKEVGEHDKLVLNLNEALKAQKAIIDKLRKSKIEEAKADLAHDMQVATFKLDVLTKGVDILEKTKLAENEIAAREIN